ncbi:hypothetical protein M8Z33_00100 [Streptomyces sp. ZAF1911]|uniref:hypothetical protein n=1 Tax=Streptomyces sp. ZAF1911 TaxID=2944129 RepID=UPI00237BED76|nr:hypothetical protein [Streptomyces sp. ZAF1911]MDD9375102.1 hypothetical protein [Streptomyces sp. ZAF1911]
MRYLAEPFILGALNRGRSVEQFLGPSGSPERLGIHWVEIRPVRGTYEVYLHAALDCEPLTSDLDSLAPLCEYEEEEFGVVVATTNASLEALDAAETRTGAVRDRWVNQSMAGDEYSDYVLAGRPAVTPDGQPWPTTQSS